MLEETETGRERRRETERDREKLQLRDKEVEIGPLFFFALSCQVSFVKEKQLIRNREIVFRKKK